MSSSWIVVLLLDTLAPPMRPVRLWLRNFAAAEVNVDSRRAGVEARDDDCDCDGEKELGNGAEKELA